MDAGSQFDFVTMRVLDIDQGLCWQEPHFVHESCMEVRASEDGIEDPDADIILVDSGAVELINSVAMINSVRHSVSGSTWVFYNDAFFSVSSIELRFPELISNKGSRPLGRYYIIELEPRHANWSNSLKEPPESRLIY